MKVTLRLIGLFSMLLLSLSLKAQLQAADGAVYRPELFKSTKLVYADTFDGPLNSEFWEVRQNTTWKIQDGILTGGPSSPEYQAKKKASADPSHAGLMPVIWLKKVPENFVCTMRVRYDGKAGKKGFPLLDLGHHIHTISFGEKATTLTIKKKVETIAVEAPLFSLNQWHEVAIELKKGTILLTIDGKKHRFDSANIDMAGQAQIDFKGLDFGTCQIDDVKVWEGMDAGTAAKRSAQTFSAVAGASLAAGCTFKSTTLAGVINELSAGVSPADGRYKGTVFRVAAPTAGPDRARLEAHLRWNDGVLEYVPTPER